METKKLILIVVISIASYLTGFSQTTEVTTFRVGAAKADITPDANALPKGYSTIRDHLYCRVIIVENETTNAALIAVDQGMISSVLYEKIVQRIEEEAGIPAINVFIAASHTHSAPWGANAAVEEGVLQAVQKAKEKLQSATISHGTGLSYININRDVIDPETRLWKQGPNSEGPSDKTVAVLTFKSLSGEPIAIYYNYAMHANTMFMSGAISADFPGETSKYIEEYYGNDMIALFSSGAAGDQNPISSQPMEEVASAKTNALLASGKAKNFEEAIMMAGFGGESDVKIDAKALDRQSKMIASLGQILGEEVLQVSKKPQHALAKISIYSTAEMITCPGRTRTNTGREGAPGTYEDGDTVNIKLSLLRIGDIAIAGVNAEVYNIIAQRLKKESPLTNTIFSSITNGASNSGYIPSDDAFQRYTFQVLSSRLQPNYAERGIIDRLVEMIGKSSLQ